MSGVHKHGSDADADANADEEVEAREGGDLGEDKELIRRGGGDTVDAAGVHCMGRDKGRGRGPDIGRTARQPSPQPSIISPKQEEYEDRGGEKGR